MAAGGDGALGGTTAGGGGGLTGKGNGLTGRGSLTQTFPVTTLTAPAFGKLDLGNRKRSLLNAILPASAASESFSSGMFITTLPTPQRRPAIRRPVATGFFICLAGLARVSEKFQTGPCDRLPPHTRKENPMFNGLWPYLWVGLGGLCGSLCRYGLTLLTQGHSVAMPLGTLGSNIAGCFIIGVVAQITTGTELISPAARLFLATGFCGGFTTLSSLIYELAQMMKVGEWWYGFLYLNATFIGAIAAYVAGTMIVKTVLKV